MAGKLNAERQKPINWPEGVELPTNEEARVVADEAQRQIRDELDKYYRKAREHPSGLDTIIDI